MFISHELAINSFKLPSVTITKHNSHSRAEIILQRLLICLIETDISKLMYLFVHMEKISKTTIDYLNEHDCNHPVVRREIISAIELHLRHARARSKTIEFIKYKRHFPQDYESFRVIEDAASFIMAKKWKTESKRMMHSSISQLLLGRGCIWPAVNKLGYPSSLSRRHTCIQRACNLCEAVKPGNDVLYARSPSGEQEGKMLREKRRQDD